MTQLTNEHFELQDANKDKKYQKTKMSNTLVLLNSNINQLIKLKDGGADDIYQELDKITDNLTDIFVDLKIQTGIDVW